MDILYLVNVFLINCGISPSFANVIDQFIVFAFGLVIAYLAAWSCRKVLIRISSRIAYKNNAAWDDIVFDRNVLSHLSNVVPTIIIYLLVPIAFADTESVTLQFIQRLCLIYILTAFVSFLNSFFKTVYTTYSQKEQLRDRPLKGLLQIAQVILWFVGGIVAVSILIDKSPFLYLPD